MSIPTNTRRHVDRPKFCWLAAERVNYNGKPMVKAYFRRTREFEGLNRPVPYEGYRVFNHRILGSVSSGFHVHGTRARDSTPHAGQVTFGDETISGVHRCVEYRAYNRWDDKGEMEEESANYRLFSRFRRENPSPEASLFRLSGYGLPEP